jgi:hypothetical protein
MFGYGRAWNEINELVGRRRVDVDPHLKGPGAERPVGKHRDRHAIEAPDPGHLVRGHLPEAEGAVREIPERTLSLQWLVDALDGLTVYCQLGQEGSVRRLQQAAGNLQFCLPELHRQRGMERPRVTVLAQATNIIGCQRTSVEQRPTVAVGPRANVPMRVHRLQAERT